MPLIIHLQSSGYDSEKQYIHYKLTMQKLHACILTLDLDTFECPVNLQRKKGNCRLKPIKSAIHLVTI